VTWQILMLPEFSAWLEALDRGDQEAVDAKTSALRERGPALGRPHVDSVEGSRHSNLKELRARGTLRVFFAFDPKRRAVLLIGGDKRGDGRFYDRMIPQADSLYDRYLSSLSKGKGIR
jgi:hypothetical protein